jgi:hypothetical protein
LSKESTYLISVVEGRKRRRYIEKRKEDDGW